MTTTMTKSAKLVNPSLPTIGMPGMSPLIRFLAKVQKGIPTVLRYGNRAQAETKMASLADRIAQEGSASAVVQVGSRFLVAIFPAEYDLDQKTGTLVTKSTCDARIGSPAGKRCGRPALPGTGFCATHTGGKKIGAVEVSKSSRTPFATVSGPRTNPRSRHVRVYCEPAIYKPTATPAHPPELPNRPSRRDQYHAVSDRLNGRGA